MLIKDKQPGIRLLSLALIISLLLTGCGLIGNGIQKGEKGDHPDISKIGLITDEGGVDDPYYQKVWEGLQKAEQDLSIGIGYLKAKNDKEYPSKLAEFGKEGYELIIAGSNAVAAVLEAAQNNPDILYICLDSTLTEPPANVLGVTNKVEEASFLAGYLAGKMTKSRVVGFISGDNKDLSLRYYYGYKAGLRLANRDSEMLKGIAGTFTNESRIKELAERMVECQADVVFHVAGSAGKKMVEVMAEAGKYSIGAYTDQNSLAPESVLTSVIGNKDIVIYELIQQFKAGKLVMGKNNFYGLAEKSVGLAESTADMISEDIYNQIMEYQDKIMAGKLTIPATENEYLNFTDN